MIKTELVVNSYLQTNYIDEKISERFFEPNNKKKLQLLSAKLINSQGESINSFDCDNKVIISLKININSLETGYYGYLSISKNDGTPVMISDSNDYKNNTFDSLKIGLNTVKIKIPARTLAPGTYSVYINFTDNLGNSLDSPGNLFSFELHDILTNRGNNRAGFFSTLLPWEIK